MRVLVTGATGFVGRALIARLAGDGHSVIAASRARPSMLPEGIAFVHLGNLRQGDAFINCSPIDAVVHLAARVHVMRDTATDPLAQFRAVNVDGTLAVARAARSAGAWRFVYLSSVKVHGEISCPGQPIHPDSPTAPIDPYGISKLEAERALSKFCEESGMELVVIRPPLVYGPGVKANFRQLMAAVARGIPLPLGAVRQNRRSMVSLCNLVDLIARCLAHPAAAGRTYLVSDGEDLSTADLVRRIGAALEIPARLVSVPIWALVFAGRLMGRNEAVQRLCGTLQVDIGHAYRELAWQPPCSADDGLRKTASWFLQQERR